MKYTVVIILHLDLFFTFPPLRNSGLHKTRLLIQWYIDSQILRFWLQAELDKKQIKFPHKINNEPNC